MNQGKKQLKATKRNAPDKIGLTKDAPFKYKLSFEGQRKFKEIE